MMMMVLYILAAYFVIGTIAGRTMWRPYVAPPAVQESIDTARGKLRAMVHGESCYRNPNGDYYRPSQNCDCGHSNEWLALQRQAQSEANLSLVERSPYPLIFGWPLLGYHKFVTGGKTRVKYNPEVAAQVTRMLEERAGITSQEDVA